MLTQTEPTYQPRFSGSDLSAQITERIRELAQATDQARLDAEMARFLEVCAKFHHYSPYNLWLILLNKPDATIVAGFHKWREMKRYVKKSEKGIPILAPILVHEDKEDETSPLVLRGFKVVYVFDISQTDGEPLPELPNWKSPQKNEELYQRLLAFARSKNIEVEVRPLPGEIQGSSIGGTIYLSPDAGTKTLIHELAHEMLHRSLDRPPDINIRELEAESVGYVVAKHFGLTDLACPTYIALHGATSELILSHLERIRSASAEIIQGVES